MSRTTLDRLFDFLNTSPMSWHAVARMTERLSEHGFIALDEREQWTLAPGGRYYTVRQGGALIAFQLPKIPLKAFNMIGAHTDSPHLRLKPEPLLVSRDWLQLGIEVYGGALLSPWYDRDLGMAGRVQVRNMHGALRTCLLDTQRSVATVPSLAIHLDRTANKGREINPQTQMAAVLTQAASITDIPNGAALIKKLLLVQQACTPDEDVVDYEVGFYDRQPAARVGLEGELIASARLDNLLSCFCGLEALLQCDGEQGVMFVANDHEEVGSGSPGGAQGTFLDDVLTRIDAAVGEGTAESRVRLLQRSLMISCDNAHALHPNFVDRHDAGQAPAINRGPVIKYNANQRYATNSETAARFKICCQKAGVPVQAFATRADMGCGSTIGPLTATALGIPTLDVGLPQWAMHSIRETAGSRDPDYLIKALTTFCNEQP